MADEKVIYALNLDKDCRILSATYDQFAPKEWPRVDHLPKGDVTDYLYKNEKYIYMPLPKEEAVDNKQPTLEELVEQKVKEILEKMEK